MYYFIFSKHRKFKNPIISNIFEKKHCFFILFAIRGNDEGKSVEIPKILGLTEKI